MVAEELFNGVAPIRHTVYTFRSSVLSSEAFLSCGVKVSLLDKAFLVAMGVLAAS